VLPVLEEELGPGVAATLARTADQLREDTAALDEVAAAVCDEVRVDDGVVCAALERHPSAVRLRVLRLAALAAGSPPSELFRTHVVALSELVPGPPGPVRGKQVQLPGHVTAYREGNLLRFRRTAVSG
jgi:tRNA(Ile)-lysidine synthase